MAQHFKYDVFLSHSSKDKVAVRQLAERLKADGLRVWLDDWVIRPGDSIPLAIEEGLETSRTLVLVMSECSVGKNSSSEWVSLERHTALFRDPTNQERRFIPLRLDNANIRDSLKQFAYVDWRESDEREYAKLLAACRKTIDADRPRELVGTESEFKDVLSGHSDDVRCVAISAEGVYAVSGSDDGTARIWELPSQRCVATITCGEGEHQRVGSVAITPDGSRVVVGGRDLIQVWSKHGTHRLREFPSGAYAVAVTSDGEKVVSASGDKKVKLWDVSTGRRVFAASGHSAEIWYGALAISEDDEWIISGSRDHTVRIWALSSGEPIATLRTGDLLGLALSPDKQRIATGGSDGAIRLWDVDSRSELARFEGHQEAVWGIKFLSGGQNLVSGSSDGSIKLWDVASGRCIGTLRGHEGSVFGLAIDDTERTLISASSDKTLRLWKLPRLPTGLELEDGQRCTNAKVLLVGDSGAGKTGLAIRLTEDRFEPTISTDAHWVTQMALPDTGERDRASRSELEREIWLWDFAGQADYRLIHQLFMDETALTVLVFNPQSENPFEGLRQWDRDLARAARGQFAKLLVAARCDRGGLMVSREAVAKFARQRGFAGYLETSALTGDGCRQLRDEIVARIEWDKIPWTASPTIFKILKDEILRLRDEGTVLLRMGELKQRLDMTLVVRSFPASRDRDSEAEPLKNYPADTSFTIDELRAVVRLLARPGILWQLEFGDFVILQPEWMNVYASAVIRSVRAHIGEIGAIREEDVLNGNLDYTIDHRLTDGRDKNGQSDHTEDQPLTSEMRRLPRSEEEIVLRAMHQTFVDHGICTREQTPTGAVLVFPAHFTLEMPEDQGHPPVLVSYRFDGSLSEVYATLVVQLYSTKAFEKGALWRRGAEFRTPSNKRMGLMMGREQEGTGEISVYFDSDVPDDVKVMFIKYVHEHLLERAQNVVRLRNFVCPHCGHPVRDSELARQTLEEHGKKARLRCQQPACDRHIVLWDLIEERFASDEFQQLIHELEEEAKATIDNESKELILVGHAFSIAGEAGQIFRPTPNSDWGIDGEIEFKDWDGHASGQRVYLQLKSGGSYLRKRKNGREIFRIKNARLRDYWQQNAYPVMLVIRTSDGEIRWMDVSAHLRDRNAGRRRKTLDVVFEGEPFTALNLQYMRDKLVVPKKARAGAC